MFSILNESTLEKLCQSRGVFMRGQNKKTKQKPLHLLKPQLYSHCGTECGSIVSSFRGNLKDLSSAADLENVVIILKLPVPDLYSPFCFTGTSELVLKLNLNQKKDCILILYNCFQTSLWRVFKQAVPLLDSKQRWNLCKIYVRFHIIAFIKVMQCFT